MTIGFRDPDPSRQCYWCGEPPMFCSWYCKRCRDLKEEAYKLAREEGASNRDEVMATVRRFIESKGIPTRSLESQREQEAKARAEMGLS